MIPNVTVITVNVNGLNSPFKNTPNTNLSRGKLHNDERNDQEEITIMTLYAPNQPAWKYT